MKWALQGYYGLGNIGDDLMLYLLIEQIQRFDADARFRVLISPAAQPSLVFVPRDAAVDIAVVEGYASYLKFLRGMDALLYGGGTCLHSFGFCGLKANLTARVLGTKVFWIGVGAESVGNGRSRRLAWLSLATVNGVTFRDESSAKIATGIQSRLSNVRVTDDLAFLLRSSPGLKRWIRTSQESARLVVSWRSMERVVPAETESRCLESLARAVCTVADTIGANQILVLSLADLVDGEANRRLEERIKSILAGSSLKVDVVGFYSSTPREKIETITSASLCVSARLHGFFLGKLMGTPTVGVSYARKVDEFARSLDRNAVITFDNLLDGPAAAVELMLHERNTPSRFEDDLGAKEQLAYENIEFLRDHVRR